MHAVPLKSAKSFDKPHSRAGSLARDKTEGGGEVRAGWVFLSHIFVGRGVSPFAGCNSRAPQL